MRRSRLLQFVVVVVLLAVCATVPAAEKAAKAGCTSACCAKAGPLHLKVDFTASTSEKNPKPVAGTTKDGCLIEKAYFYPHIYNKSGKGGIL